VSAAFAPSIMSPEDAEEYTQALGQVVAGGWRQVALGQRLGVPEALGISTAEWVERQLGGYVRLSIVERREAVKELTAPHEDGGQGLTTRQAAEILGVSKNTVARDAGLVPNGTDDRNEQEEMTLEAVPNGTDDLPTYTDDELEAVLPDSFKELSPKEQAAQETRTRRDVSRSASVLPDAMDLRRGDARVEMESVPDCSLSLVLTDPPYGDEAESLYAWLAEWADRKLMPGGSLVCYTGQSRLNRDMALFDRHLRYWWLLTMRHDRAQRLPGKFVIVESKPVLWYVKEYRRGRTLVPDTLSSERDQSAHPWAQGTGGVAQVIEHLTDPGETIGDPFAGTAKWGEIAARMGRRWVGCDLVYGGTATVELEDVEGAA
jgi:hypothetical protein